MGANEAFVKSFCAFLALKVIIVSRIGRRSIVSVDYTMSRIHSSVEPMSSLHLTYKLLASSSGKERFDRISVSKTLKNAQKQIEKLIYPTSSENYGRPYLTCHCERSKAIQEIFIAHS